MDTTSWEDLAQRGGFQARETPLLVKGAVTPWPATENWTFEKLAALRNRDGSEVVSSFQNGLVEQGLTKEPIIQPIAPYLRGLAQDAAQRAQRPLDGLLSAARLGTLRSGERFVLDWSYLKTFEPNQAYLAQWYILNEFPALRADFAIRQLWPGLRFTWEYTFIGPADTVTGLHYDFPNNWFCQVEGVKEFILFPRSQSEHLSTSRKFDWGATLSDLNITQLEESAERAQRFARAHGWYARVESGDALFIPRRTWHAVVALRPSISLAVFGLTPWETLRGGLPAQLRAGLHAVGLYRRDNCTCHRQLGAPD
ncbi:MAG TPA: cupin-like domain-containing protein [Polyangiales bacterium]